MTVSELEIDLESKVFTTAAALYHDHPEARDHIQPHLLAALDTLDAVGYPIANADLYFERLRRVIHIAGNDILPTALAVAGHKQAVDLIAHPMLIALSDQLLDSLTEATTALKIKSK